MITRYVRHVRQNVMCTRFWSRKLQPSNVYVAASGPPVGITDLLLSSEHIIIARRQLRRPSASVTEWGQRRFCDLNVMGATALTMTACWRLCYLLHGALWPFAVLRLRNTLTYLPRPRILFSPVSVSLNVKRSTQKLLTKYLWNFVKWLGIIQRPIS